MGYTHYWAISKPKTISASEFEATYQKAVAACNKLIRAYQKNAGGLDRLSGYSAHTSEYGGINFNGKEDNSHEPFVLREHANQNGPSFCKTAEKPYDLVVVACLATLKYYLKGGIDVASDGLAADWSAGVEFAATTLKRKIKIPSTILVARGVKAA